MPIIIVNTSGSQKKKKTFSTVVAPFWNRMFPTGAIDNTDKFLFKIKINKTEGKIVIDNSKVFLQSTSLRATKNRFN